MKIDVINLGSRRVKQMEYSKEKLFCISLRSTYTVSSCCSRRCVALLKPQLYLSPKHIHLHRYRDSYVLEEYLFALAPNPSLYSSKSISCAQLYAAFCTFFIIYFSFILHFNNLFALQKMLIHFHSIFIIIYLF